MRKKHREKRRKEMEIKKQIEKKKKERDGET